MMVYILCVDRSSGIEERKENASAMSGERETPKGSSVNYSYAGGFCFIILIFSKHPNSNQCSL